MRAILPVVCGLLLCAAGNAAHAQTEYLSGHAGPVYSVTFTPSGQLLTGSFDKSVKLWDPSTGQPLRTWSGHTDLVLSVTASADGQQWASAGSDQQVHLYRQPVTAPVAQLAGVASETTSLALSPDGQYLLAGNRADQAALWELAGGERLREFVGPQDDVLAVAISPDGKQAAAASADGTLRAWDIESAEPLGTYGTAMRVKGLAFAPDGSALVAGGEDGRLRLYAWPPVAIPAVDASSPLNVAVSAPDQQWLALAGEDGIIRLYNTADRSELRAIETGRPVRSLHVSADGTLLLAGGADGVVTLANPADGAIIEQFSTSTAAVEQVLLLPDTNELLTASADGVIRRWQAAGVPIAQVEVAPGEPVTALSLTADAEQLLATAGTTNKLLAVEDLNSAKDLPAASSPIIGAGLGGEAERLAVADSTGRVRLISPASGGVLSLESGVAEATIAATSPDGSLVAIGNAEGAVTLWRTSDGSSAGTLAGQPAPLNALQFTANGEQLITASANHVRWWNVADGAEIRAVDTGAAIQALAVSSSGTLAVAGEDQKIRFYAVADGAEQGELAAHAAAVRAIAFSGSGARMVTAGADNLVKLWDTASRQLLEQHTLSEAPSAVAMDQAGGTLWVGTETGAVQALTVRITGQLATGEALHDLALIPGTRTVVVGGAGRDVRLFDLDTGRATRSLQGPVDSVFSVTVSPDGQYLAAGSKDGHVRLWKLDQGVITGLWRTGQPVQTVAFTADGAKLVAGDDQLARIYDLERLREEARILGHTGPVRGLALLADQKVIVTAGADQRAQWYPSPLISEAAAHRGPINDVLYLASGGQLLTAGDDKQVILWDAATGEAIRRFEGARAGVKDLSVSADGSILAAGGDDGVIRVWDLASGAELMATSTPLAVTALELSPDAALVYIGAGDNVVRAYAVPTGALLWESERHKAAITALALSSDGTRLYSASLDKSIKQWAPPTSGPQQVLSGHVAPVYAVGFNPQGDLVASGGADSVVKLWNVADGSPRGELTGHDAQIYAVAFHPGGELLASTGADGTVRLWNAADGTLVRDWDEGLAGGMYCLGFSPTGDQLAVGGLGKTWYLIATDGETPPRTFSGHQDHVYGVRFNPAGSRAATIGYAGNLIIWDLESGSPLWQEQLDVEAGFSLAYSPDGKQLAVGTTDHRVLVVPVPEAAQ